MRPDYKPAAKLSEQERHELSDTPTVRICVGPSTHEQPFGQEFKLPIGLVKHYSSILAGHFSNTALDSGSCAAICGIYLLPARKPELFQVIADYILYGHATFLTKLGLPPSAETTTLGARNKDGINLAQVAAEAGTQLMMSQTLMFCEAAEEVNSFITLCDKLAINEALSSVLVAYEFICRFAILHKLPFMPSCDRMMPWGSLGQLLDIQSESLLKMLPKDVFLMAKLTLKHIFEDVELLGEPVDEEVKIYLGMCAMTAANTTDDKKAVNNSLEEKMQVSHVHVEAVLPPL